MTVYRNLDLPGVAWVIDRPCVYEDEDGCEQETGMVIAHMVGDDRPHMVDPEDLVPIEDEDYCPGCGQIGCGHGR